MARLTRSVAGTVTLWSRNGAYITHTFPEITAAVPEAMAGRPVILVRCQGPSFVEGSRAAGIW